jgi:hypothetical protein
MARVAHANAVRVFDVGSHQGHVFLAMELIDGVTVADWLAEKPRRWREVVDVYRAAGRVRTTSAPSRACGWICSPPRGTRPTSRSASTRRSPPRRRRSPTPAIRPTRPSSIS